MRQVLRRPAPAAEPVHEPDVPVLVPTLDPADEVERPFQEGAGDALETDLRHRMVSEAAYYLYQQRGYADGFELDDWLQAEAQIDHLALHPARDDVEERSAPRSRQA